MEEQRIRREREARDLQEKEAIDALFQSVTYLGSLAMFHLVIVP